MAGGSKIYSFAGYIMDNYYLPPFPSYTYFILYKFWRDVSYSIWNVFFSGYGLQIHTLILCLLLSALLLTPMKTSPFLIMTFPSSKQTHQRKRIASMETENTLKWETGIKMQYLNSLPCLWKSNFSKFLSSFHPTIHIYT